MSGVQSLRTLLLLLHLLLLTPPPQHFLNHAPPYLLSSLSSLPPPPSFPPSSPVFPPSLPVSDLFSSPNYLSTFILRWLPSVLFHSLHHLFPSETQLPHNFLHFLPVFTQSVTCCLRLLENQHFFSPPSSATLSPARFFQLQNCTKLGDETQLRDDFVSLMQFYVPLFGRFICCADYFSPFDASDSPMD